MSFISSTEIAHKKSEKKNAWKTILKEEEKKYIHKQKIKERKRQRGDSKWILPNVENRLQEESKIKSKKHKSKKSKKSKKKKHSSSGESDEWEEKPCTSLSKNESLSYVVAQPQDKEDKMDFLNMHTFSRDDIRQKSRKELERENNEKLQKELLSQREINPYWKDSGDGLPINKIWSKKPEKSKTFEKDWLLKSLKRMKEEAASTGKSLENVAAERYGSWEKFEQMLGGDINSSTKSTGFVKPSFDDDDDARTSHKRKNNLANKTSFRKSWKRSKVEDQTLHDNSSDKSQDVEIQTKQNNVRGCQPPPNIIEDVTVSQKNSISVTLTEKEKNQLAAKIIKAELIGNTKLAIKLKEKLQNARNQDNHSAEKSTIIEQDSDESENESGQSVAGNSDEDMVVLTHTAKDGQVWPVKEDSTSTGRKSKKRTVTTHGNDRERDRYFADDDRYSLKELVEREKTSTAEDQDEMFSRLASKQFNATDADTLDDMFVSQAAKGTCQADEEAKRRQQAIASHKKLARRLDKCHLCFGNQELPKHLIICIGKKCMLMLPHHMPLTDGHCMIVPMHHCVTGTGLDEDVWEEITEYIKSLTQMFASNKSDCIFMQTCMKLNKSYHFFIDCIPLEKELGDMAPIYFKKAIQESDTEWSQNKKLVDTRIKGLRRSIPKGLPYFSVDFGNDGGFAHVVEDENVFPSYFGREVIGGMLDVEPRLWRKPPCDHFHEQTKRALKFSKMWKNFDFTN